MNQRNKDTAKQTIPIAIPTLTQYAKLTRLCERIRADYNEYTNIKPEIFIIDNGGKLSKTIEGRIMSKYDNISVATPQHNLGVASSWNIFAKQIGRCIIANDDVLFGKGAIDEFTKASKSKPQSIIIENDHPVGGFSTFLLNNPEEWLSLGGFDELFNPAYFEDNDTRYRLKLAGKPVERIRLSDWEHDNSSTLENASHEYQRMHWCLFKRNSEYYIKKWGGLPGKETYKKPFENIARTETKKSRHSSRTHSINKLRGKLIGLLKRSN